MSTWTRERARIAGLSRDRSPDDAELVEARRNLKAIRLEQAVQKALASAPPLTAEQCQHIARLLTAGGGAR